MLFHVQDEDRPLFVVADDYGHAIRKWQNIIREENDDCDVGLPLGVAIVAEDNELVIGEVTVAEENRRAAAAAAEEEIGL